MNKTGFRRIKNQSVKVLFDAQRTPDFLNEGDRLDEFLPCEVFMHQFFLCYFLLDFFFQLFLLKFAHSQQLGLLVIHISSKLILLLLKLNLLLPHGGLYPHKTVEVNSA